MPGNVGGYRCRAALIVMLMVIGLSANAGGGYFDLGYGHMSKQMASANTAVIGDAFAGASNPAKLVAAGDRTDFGFEFFLPSRRVKRSGSGTPYDMESTSRNSLFMIPELAFSRQLNDGLAVGLTIYANGGLNTEYRDDNGVPGSNFNPAECGAAPANIFLGCGKAGFDLTQLVIAPTIAWKVNERHAFGIAPLIAVQRFEAYGLQAFAPLSKYPTKVSNHGHDIALGYGARVGWYGDLYPWLSAGVSYSTKLYMQEFEHYKGLFAEGSFDIPANYSIGVALRPTDEWLVAVDLRRIEWGEVNALSNGVLNSLLPGGPAQGSQNGSGFNWNSRNSVHVGIAYKWSPRLTLRAGVAYGKRPNDDSINSVTFNLLAPNANRAYSAGLTWEVKDEQEFHLSLGHYVEQTYRGPSATAVIGVGGTEEITAHVEMITLGWSWKY